MIEHVNAERGIVGASATDRNLRLHLCATGGIAKERFALRIGIDTVAAAAGPRQGNGIVTGPAPPVEHPPRMDGSNRVQPTAHCTRSEQMFVQINEECLNVGV